ncbi:MAG TPA: ABC transporter permease [Candidatus Methylomirabilis sp.]|nr:ABC transporter permease [Candidatus Methylomirabilis sp.]
MAIWSSMRFSLRILRKHWKLTSIAAFSLAIAMAAGAVGFSVFNALLLRPPAVFAPNRLVTVYTSTPTDEFNGMCYDDYKYYRDNNQVFSAAMAFPYSIALNPIVYGQHTKGGLVNAVSDTYFSVLGVEPILGRVFTKGEDDKPSAVAVLSYAYWKWLGADGNIAGKTISINNVPLTVVGVMPKSFVGTIFSDLPDVWYPLSMIAVIGHEGQDWRADRTVRPLRMVGRLRAGVTREQALANLETIAKQLAAAYPKTNKDRVARVTDTRMLPEDSVSSARTISALLFVIAALVIFAACSNVANLLLALGSARRHEILVRAAMGATRGRLIREALLDSTLIAGGGGVLGFLLASLAMRELLQFKPYIPGLGFLPLTIDFRPDMTVLAATAGLVFVVGLATGLVPGLYSSTPNLAGALSGEIAVGGTRKGRVRNSLVAMQVAVCTVVLIGVGLCFRSLNNLRHVNLGFSTRNIAILTADLQAHGYSEEQGRKLIARMREAAQETYGVESVTLSNDIPVSQNEGNIEQVHFADSVSTSGSGEGIAFAVVDENYFATLGIPVLAGRVFTAADAPKGPEVVIVNHFMAERYWPGQNPIGKTVRIENGNRVATVVGVVGDGKYVDIDEPLRPFMYFDLNQHYQSAVYLLARTQGPPRQWLSPLSEALQKVDPVGPGLFFMNLTIDDWLDFALFVPRITLICISGFGGLAFLLAAVGLYGAVFYSVSERKKELGIRVALGARPGDLWSMILRQTSALTAAGVGLGIAGGMLASMLVRSLLYGIGAVEWTVFAAVAVTMAGMTFLTAYSAARPWISADPLESVRHA